MGSLIEINDTLKISKERGFPAQLNLEDHIHDPAKSSLFLSQEFLFWNKDERLYNRPPSRVFLVEEIDGKWLYWGHAQIIAQTINAGRTQGTYKIMKLYSPEYQRLATLNEAPQGKSYF